MQRHTSLRYIQNKKLWIFSKNLFKFLIKNKQQNVTILKFYSSMTTFFN